MNTAVGISSLSADETIDYMLQLQHERSVSDARMVRAMAHFYALREHIENGKYASDEIAAELSWSTRTAADAVGTAVRLVERLPDTVTALESGRLDMRKARAILDWTDPLPVEQAREVAATVQDWSVGRTPAAVRQKLSREVIKIDPQGAEARRQQRITQRSVSYFPAPDGMATLTVFDSAERIRALYDLLDHLARQAKAAGDAGTLDMLRADAFAGLLLGECSQRVRVELRVTVPASVLAGVSQAPGWLHGYGPITHQAVRTLAEHSDFWRRVVTDPLTGTVVEVSRRQPTASLREYVNTRTPTCVAVGCSRPSQFCEVDHTRDYAHGGRTADANLGPACRRHNLMKLDGGWRLTQPESGHYVWTTPSGRRYEVTPEPVVEPTPDPAPIDLPPPF